MAAMELQKHGMKGHYIHEHFNASRGRMEHELHPLAELQPNVTSHVHKLYDNDTIDVTLMSCFGHYDTLACTR